MVQGKTVFRGFKKMRSYTKCPNCAEEGLTIPMSEENGGLVCSLCGTIVHSNP